MQSSESLILDFGPVIYFLAPIFLFYFCFIKKSISAIDYWVVSFPLIVLFALRYDVGCDYGAYLDQTLNASWDVLTSALARFQNPLFSFLTYGVSIAGLSGRVINALPIVAFCWLLLLVPDFRLRLWLFLVSFLGVFLIQHSSAVPQSLAVQLACAIFILGERSKISFAQTGMLCFLSISFHVAGFLSLVALWYRYYTRIKKDYLLVCGSFLILSAILVLFSAEEAFALAYDYLITQRFESKGFWFRWVLVFLCHAWLSFSATLPSTDRTIWFLILIGLGLLGIVSSPAADRLLLSAWSLMIFVWGFRLHQGVGLWSLPSRVVVFLHIIAFFGWSLGSGHFAHCYWNFKVMV